MMRAGFRTVIANFVFLHFLLRISFNLVRFGYERKPATRIMYRSLDLSNIISHFLCSHCRFCNTTYLASFGGIHADAQSFKYMPRKMHIYFYNDFVWKYLTS
ncbi:hypothetical protein Csa_005201 [Cucumis sativus]|uniref:Uncharacterized protein n=1 Tax=Cucumis sativus TaxID=3659 RepID=A0A0A0KB62_CUCSA|nr:hypothetical protein Csa_005201 [Cucumis sativus]